MDIILLLQYIFITFFVIILFTWFRYLIIIDIRHEIRKEVRNLISMTTPTSDDLSCVDKINIITEKYTKVLNLLILEKQNLFFKIHKWTYKQFTKDI